MILPGDDLQSRFCAASRVSMGRKALGHGFFSFTTATAVWMTVCSTYLTASLHRTFVSATAVFAASVGGIEQKLSILDASERHPRCVATERDTPCDLCAASLVPDGGPSSREASGPGRQGSIGGVEWAFKYATVNSVLASRGFDFLTTVLSDAGIVGA